MRRKAVFEVQTIHGILPGSDEALRAGEDACDVLQSKSGIRVFTPGPDSNMVEIAVVDEKTSWSHVTLPSVAVGAVGAGVFVALGAPATYALIWLFTSVGAGLILARWLKARKSRDGLFAKVRPSPRVEQEIRAGHAVVTAIVATESDAETVGRVIEDAGGRVSRLAPAPPPPCRSSLG